MRTCELACVCLSRASFRTSSSSRLSRAYSHTLFLPRKLTLRSSHVPRSLPPLLISFHLIVTLSFCSAQNFVFAYRCAVTPIYAIFMAVTVTVFQETCIELNCTNAQLGVITASMGVGFFIQLYWFYVINW